MSMDKQTLAAARCTLCASGAPHHTNSEMSIGGLDRRPVYDIHAVEDAGGVGLAECTAASVWDPRLA